ncbi:MAG: ankyrin repeat domain-containing protein [Desulfomonilaceae bacterium]
MKEPNRIDRIISHLYERPSIYVLGVLITVVFYLGWPESRHVWGLFLSFFVGAAFSLGLNITLDEKRKPVLTLSPMSVFANDAGTAQQLRPMLTLRVKVTNEAPSWWHSRLPAMRCFAKLSIYQRHMITEKFNMVTQGEVNARWATLPQLLPSYGWSSHLLFSEDGIISQTVGLPLQLYDPMRYDPPGQDPEQRVDIYPGEDAELDIVSRFLDEETCFVWNNQFYQPAPDIRFFPVNKYVPKLTYGHYLVRLKLRSSSARSVERYFDLHFGPGEYRLTGPHAAPPALLETESNAKYRKNRLRAALYEKNSTKMWELLKDTSFISETNGSKWTPLMFFSYRGDCQTVKLLLDSGASVDGQEDAGYTPLMIAISENHLHVVKLFLRYRADVNLASKAGLTPLMIASSKGNLKAIRFLLDHGANREARDQHERTALEYAHRDYLDKIRQMLTY